MKTFLLQLFTWWHGQTMGTRLFTWLRGSYVGEDEFGNKYYRNDGIPPHGERRWVVYAGEAEASAVPPSWHGWLHHTVDVPPTEEDYTVREWERPHLPNMTGTAAAYRPAGSTLRANARPSATGDYEAWTP
ncbi:NADH:ubiquinone oxidoreductase subunit NDUFA12 [Tepidamorphus sp. 3E244]|uniref:NADH:ubiquinone oxidoreductase subunit NDUFA12 n=1 Tax=Tepidamorphus sp. 3E244 TaxID=3385498 RepID=UPI0038FD3D65